MSRYNPPSGYKLPNQPYSKYGYDGQLWVPGILGKMPTIMPGPVGGPLRFVASRLQFPPNFAAIASMMTRFATFARDNITSVKLAWPNWVGLSGGVGVNSMSINASIEYPAGVFTQVTFALSPTGVAPANTTLWSDFINVNIPIGAQFWVRTWQVGTTGCVFLAASPDALIGEASSFPGANQTMGGNVTQNANQMCAPCAIVGRSLKPAAMIFGDSRQEGVGDNFQRASGGFAEMGNGLNAFALSCLGVPGMTGAAFLAGVGALVLDFVQYSTDVVSAFGVNDIIGGASAATLQATQASIRPLFPNKKFHVTTLDPDTTSTDSWATLANQTIFANNAARVTYNTAVRANSLGFDQAYDCAVVSESSLNSGKWQVDGTANKYTVDGLHQSPFCYNLYASAGFTI